MGQRACCKFPKTLGIICISLNYLYNTLNLSFLIFLIFHLLLSSLLSTTPPSLGPSSPKAPKLFPEGLPSFQGLLHHPIHHLLSPLPFLGKLSTSNHHVVALFFFNVMHSWFGYVFPSIWHVGGVLLGWL